MFSNSVVHLVILCSLASLKSGEGNKDTCIEVSEDAASTSTGVISISSFKLMYTGNDRFREGNFEKAVVCYNEAIDIHDDEAKFYRNRGLSHEKLEMMEEALADHMKALDLEPYNVRGRFNMGRLLFELRRFDEAVDHLQKALDYGDERYMSNDESHQIKTMLEEGHQRIEEALDAKRKAREQDLFLYLRSLIVQDTQRKIVQTQEQKHIGTSDQETQNLIKRHELDREYYLEKLAFAFADEKPTPMTTLSIPEYLCDRICYDIMREPVITPSGITYEKAQIKRHLTTKHTDPTSREELRLDQLRTNKALKTAIEDYMRKNGLTYRFIEENP